MPSRTQRRPRKSSSATPIILFVVLVAGAIGVAGWSHSAKQRAAAEDRRAREQEEAVDPFAGVPDEAPPAPRGSASGTGTGIEAHPTWKKALELTDGAWKLVDEAKAAKAKDDYTTFNAKGKAAREAFNEALDLTAQWELDVTEEHGENDPHVRRITRTRNDWFDQLRILHRTTSR